MKMQKRVKKDNTGRYCTIKDSLSNSLKEVKLHQQKKTKLDTWQEYLKKKEE